MGHPARCAGVLKSEEIPRFSIQFARKLARQSIPNSSTGDHVNAFQPLDALARLIVLMIKYNTGVDDAWQCMILRNSFTYK